MSEIHRQCAKCPWKKSTDPNKIPGGYSRVKHAALKNTIAEPGRFDGSTVHAMACHETAAREERACVGWLANQLGPGNNLALRLKVISGALSGKTQLDGEQHERFEDTLPKRKRTA